MKINYLIKEKRLTYVGDEDDLAGMITGLCDQVARDLQEGGVRVSETEALTSRIVCRYFDVVDEQCERADLGELTIFH